jgi:hypothetical protein
VGCTGFLFVQRQALSFLSYYYASERDSEKKMGLGVLEDHHLQHVPGTALLADMVGDSHEHQYHGTSSPCPAISLPNPNKTQAATPQA